MAAAQRLLQQHQVDAFGLQLEQQHVVVERQRTETDAEHQHAQGTANHAVAVGDGEQAEDETEQEQPGKELADQPYQAAEGVEQVEQNGLDGAHGDLRVVDESESRVHRLNGGIMPELAAVSLP